MMVRLSAECVVRCPLELIHSHAKRLHDPGKECQWAKGVSGIGYLTAHLHHLQKLSAQFATAAYVVQSCEVIGNAAQAYA